MGDTEEYNAENLNYEAEGDGAGAEEEMEDPELEDIKARVRAMEEEAEKLKLLQSEVWDFVLRSVGDLDPEPDPPVFGLPDPDWLVRGPDPDSLIRGTDPDPHQNVTDPQHLFSNFRFCETLPTYLTFGTRLEAGFVSW